MAIKEAGCLGAAWFHVKKSSRLYHCLWYAAKTEQTWLISEADGDWKQKLIIFKVLCGSIVINGLWIVANSNQAETND